MAAGLRAFASMFVVVPSAAITMARSLHLNPSVEVAIVAIAFSPLPPILPGKKVRLGGRACFVTRLLVAATLISIFAPPFGLALAGHVFGVKITMSIWQAGETLVITIFAPLLAGFARSALLGQAMPQASRASYGVGTAILGISGLVLLVELAPSMIALIGQGTLLALAAMCIAGLATGHLLAGDETADQVTLSLASATRHPGIALAIAIQKFPAAGLPPAAIVLSLIVSLTVSLPYIHFIKRKLLPNEH